MRMFIFNKRVLNRWGIGYKLQHLPLHLFLSEVREILSPVPAYPVPSASNPSDTRKKRPINYLARLKTLKHLPLNCAFCSTTWPCIHSLSILSLEASGTRQISIVNIPPLSPRCDDLQNNIQLHLNLKKQKNIEKVINTSQSESSVKFTPVSIRSSLNLRVSFSSLTKKTFPQCKKNEQINFPTSSRIQQIPEL